MTTDNEGWITQDQMLEAQAAFLVALAEHGVSPDIGECLIHGGRNYPPHALKAAIKAIAPIIGNREHLQAENQRLREALQEIKSAAECPQQAYDRNGPSFTSPSGLEYEFSSDFLAKCNDLGEIARKALEASQ